VGASGPLALLVAPLLPGIPMTNPSP